MRAKLEPRRSKYLVAFPEPGHGLAHQLDCSGELRPEYLDFLWTPKAVHESYEEWIGFSQSPVRSANRRRMDANKDFIVLGNRLFDVLDFENVRGAVSGIDGGFHKRMEVCGSCRFKFCCISGT